MACSEDHNHIMHPDLFSFLQHYHERNPDIDGWGGMGVELLQPRYCALTISVSSEVDTQDI